MAICQPLHVVANSAVSCFNPAMIDINALAACNELVTYVRVLNTHPRFHSEVHPSPRFRNEGVARMEGSRRGRKKSAPLGAHSGR